MPPEAHDAPRRTTPARSGTVLLMNDPDLIMVDEPTEVEGTPQNLRADEAVRKEWLEV